MGTLTPEYRWLLPSALTVEPDAVRPMRRSTRDWVVDSLCFVLGLGFTVLATIDLIDGELHIVRDFIGSAAWVVWLDTVVSVALAAGLWWRRRFPVQLALIAVAIGTFSLASAASQLILMFTVTVHRRSAVAAPIVAPLLAANLIFTAVRPEQGTGYLESVLFGTGVTVIVMLWGMVVRARRQLVVSLRDRAERAESEQQLRVAQARALERN